MTQNDFDVKISQCKTLKELFDLCEEHYEIENTKLGIITKQLVISGLKKAIRVLNPKVR